MKRLLISLLLLLSAGAACADEDLQAELRFVAAQTEPGWVGQELELYLEIWSTGFSFSNQNFVLPEVRGAFLLQADSSTVKLNETRDGESWQGLRYYLLLYPQRAGVIEVPGFGVGFSVSAGYGSMPTDFEFTAESLQLEARLPPGARSGELLVSSSTFSVESSWQPEPEDGALLNLQVGDALTRVVERIASDVPGMVFAPLPQPEIPGLVRYVEAPQVRDRINRGQLTGMRQDTHTYICQQAGHFVIPETVFQWFDPATSELSEIVLPALELEVAASVAYGSGSGRSRQSSVNSWPWLVSAVLVLLLGLALRLSWTRIVAAWRQWRRRVESSEDWAFRSLRKACYSGTPAQAYAAISVWMDRSPVTQRGQTLVQFARSLGDEAFLKEALALQRQLVSNSATEWSGRELAKLLAQHRQGLQGIAQRSHGLPPLNP